MKRVSYLIATTIILITPLLADDSDWIDDSWDSEAISEMEKENDTFKKMEIKNRSKKEYKDRVYKYIENRDYNVKNNNIQIATVELDNDLRSSDVKVNVLTENLKVEGDRYRGDTMELRQNSYKHFVKHDELPTNINKKESEDSKSSDYGDDIEKNQEEDRVLTLIEPTDPLYEKVDDDTVSELEVIDLRDKDEIKEVNIYIKDTTIRVGSNYED